MAVSWNTSINGYTFTVRVIVAGLRTDWQIQKFLRLRFFGKCPAMDMRLLLPECHLWLRNCSS